MQVLLVEDSATTRRVFEAMLQKRGHEVTSCADAESALAKYATTPYPLVVLDWLLPGMDGLELCRRIRACPHGDRSIVLMVTARDRADDLRAVLEAGADDYVPKPIAVDAFDVRLAVAERQVEHLQQRKRAEADLAGAMAQTARSRDDLLAILNQLPVGTAMTEADDRLSFVSRAAAAMLGQAADSLVGRRWAEGVPLTADDRARIRDMADRAPAARATVTVHVERPTAPPGWIDIHVHDDPRTPGGHIYVLYDVSDLHALRQLLDEKAHFADLIGKSDVMLQVYQQIRQIAQVDSTVLIEGDTGTGKELVARAIHYAGPRKDGPFIAVNCAGLTDSLLASQLFGHRRGAFTDAVGDHKGYFEAAGSGTLFLDEIGDVSPAVQTSLLRVLQEKEIVRLGDATPRTVDVRVIAATHHDLVQDVAAGRFRSDLLYRIRVARITMPPLRDRRSDIPALVGAFVAQCRAAMGKPIDGVTEAALRQLMAYPWPGNVRELKSAIEYAAIRCMSTAIDVDDLPPEVQPGAGPDAPQASPVAPPTDERSRIVAALAATNGNRKEAARHLGISRATLYRRLAELGIGAGEA